MGKSKNWCVTGFSMQTVAGTENNFNLNQTVGYTSSQKSDWTTCVDQSSIEKFYECIEKTIIRALVMAKLDIDSQYKISLIVASNFFENSFLEKNSEHREYVIPKLKSKFKINSLVISNSTACASGASAIVTACQILDEKISDICIVVGYDIESEIPKNGMKRLGALSKDTISPFSLKRTGTDLADGIGVLIIENFDSVKNRNSKIYSQIIGYGVNNDAYNPTSPNPSGIALFNGMKNALKMANILIEEITYNNAHGSGTVLNDLIETNIIKKIFKEHSYKLFINSSKSIIGHTLGAAGIVELIITIIQMNNQTIHPTANFLDYDSNCDLNYNFKKSTCLNVEYAISNSIGFGGTNISIVLKKGDVI